MTPTRRSSPIFGAALLLAGAVLLGVVFVGTGKMGVPLDRQLALVGGMSASVAPNEVNLLAQQLKEWESELSERERTLSVREDALAEQLREEVTNEYLWVITLLVVSILLLLGLIGINFYLDAMRERRRNNQSASSAGLEVRL